MAQSIARRNANVGDAEFFSCSNISNSSELEFGAVERPPGIWLAGMIDHRCKGLKTHATCDTAVARRVGRGVPKDGLIHGQVVVEVLEEISTTAKP